MWVQVLDMTASVGSPLPLPLQACVSGSNAAADAQVCTVVAHGHGDEAGSSPEGWSLDFKAAPDPSCTFSRVQEGLCSSCTAKAAAEAQCAAGTHTFIVDAVSPDGLRPVEALAVVLHIGAALLSSEVWIQVEVLADTRGFVGGEAEIAEARLQNMLAATQVRAPELCKVNCVIWHSRNHPALP